jgi:hypothetical protein
MALALILTSHLRAQSTIHGAVVDRSSAPIPNALVLNANLGTHSLTNLNGGFTVTALPGDTLRVTSMGFVSVSVVILDTSDLRIRMTPDTVKLKPVTVLHLKLRDALLELKLPAEHEVIIENPLRPPPEPLRFRYPVANPYPGVYVTLLPPLGIAAAVNLDQLILEIKERTPKPRRARLLPAWE